MARRGYGAGGPGAPSADLFLRLFQFSQPLPATTSTSGSAPTNATTTAGTSPSSNSSNNNSAAAFRFFNLHNHDASINDLDSDVSSEGEAGPEQAAAWPAGRHFGNSLAHSMPFFFGMRGKNLKIYLLDILGFFLLVIFFFRGLQT